MIKKYFVITAICLAALSWDPGASAAAADLMFDVQPDTVQIGAGYNGATVSIAGRVPSDSDAVIRLTGKSENYKLKEKGRALGVLWMNLGSVEISNVPDLFLLYLPESMKNKREYGDASQQTLTIGLTAVRQGAEIEAQNDDKNGLFDEFVKLKQKAGLYDTVHGGVRYGADQDGMKAFNASVALPSSLPQGAFDIEVFVVKNGSVEASATRQIKAEEVGMPAWIANIAFNHGTLYGVLAVLVAVMAGLFTGVLFKGEKGAH